MEGSSKPDRAGATVPGYIALISGFGTLASPFVIWPTTAKAALWVFITGAVLLVVTSWFGIRALLAPKGSTGRGAAAAGIILGILGISWSGFLAIVSSILENDSIL